MDGTLTLIFANSLTTQDVMTKISASLQLTKKQILTKFGGCGSKMGRPCPSEVLEVFGGKSKFFGPQTLQIFYKGGFYQG